MWVATEIQFCASTINDTMQLVTLISRAIFQMGRQKSLDSGHFLQGAKCTMNPNLHGFH
uniref:Uncharacterized protein n=1 Tax=Arundo donax TaxID=35708 RepID=A0A0A9ENI3_ARUDO